VGDSAFPSIQSAAAARLNLVYSGRDVGGTEEPDSTAGPVAVGLAAAVRVQGGGWSSGRMAPALVMKHLTILLLLLHRGMLEQWEDDMRANRDLDMAALRAMAPATRRALESSGRSGTTMSFGGGGGGGGGGAGSSW
jgi:hypothetical protein